MGGSRVQRSREEHAGQKLYFRYDSVLGGQRRIEVDVNFKPQATASSPLLATNVSSFKEGPCGCFSPRSH